MKYRIISKTQYELTTYYAQGKFFGLFWINLPYTSASGNERWINGGENPSSVRELVENYVEMLMSGYFFEKSKVVKTYE